MATKIFSPFHDIIEGDGTYKKSIGYLNDNMVSYAGLPSLTAKNTARTRQPQNYRHTFKSAFSILTQT